MLVVGRTYLGWRDEEGLASIMSKWGGFFCEGDDSERRGTRRKGEFGSEDVPFLLLREVVTEVR